jgi:hypothetical protein
MALALAHVWPRPVLLAECDPAGGDVAAGYLAGGGDPGRNLLDLTVTARRTNLHSALQSHLVALDDTGTRTILPGLRGPDQAAAVVPWWDRLAAMFGELRDVDGPADGRSAGGAVDVLADCGRLATGHPPAAVLRRADAVVLVLRPTLRSVAHAQTAVRAPALGDPGRARLLLAALVGAGQPYTTREVTRALRIPVVEVAHDPRAAAVFSDGATAERRFVTSALLRSARTLADQLSIISSGDPTDPVAAMPVAASNGNWPAATTSGEVS